MASTRQVISSSYNTNKIDFNAKEFQANLRTEFIGRSFIYRHLVDSTMQVAQREETEGCAHGTLVLAECQSHGIGRGGRDWVSQPNGNLYFSIVLRPRVFTDLYKLNFSICLAVCLSCDQEGIKTNVKWPNDVWYDRSKKLSGMLINTSFVGKEASAIVGIGINVNEDMMKTNNAEIQKVATSLFNITGRQINRERFLANVCNHLEDLTIKPMEAIIELYKNYDLLCGNDVVVMPKGRDNPERVDAKAITFSPEGALVVQYQDGTTKELVAEEVSIRPKI
jgi:BirA family biotin operon repressor/biotin-[acetyl-CoA-carboxylase] ligase